VRWTGSTALRRPLATGIPSRRLPGCSITTYLSEQRSRWPGLRLRNLRFCIAAAQHRLLGVKQRHPALSGQLRTLELGRQISQGQTLSAAKILPRLMQSVCRTRRATRFLGWRQGPFVQHARRVPPAVSRGSLRSFQLTNQAIDSYQNSESEMHSHRHNKHQDSYLDAHNLCCQQKNDHAGETYERCDDANDKLWRLILRHRSCARSRCVRLRPSWRRRVGLVGGQFRRTGLTFYPIGRMIAGSR